MSESTLDDMNVLFGHVPDVGRVFVTRNIAKLIIIMRSIQFQLEYLPIFEDVAESGKGLDQSRTGVVCFDHDESVVLLDDKGNRRPIMLTHFVDLGDDLFNGMLGWL